MCIATYAQCFPLLVRTHMWCLQHSTPISSSIPLGGKCTTTSCTLVRKHFLDFRLLIAGMKPNKECTYTKRIQPARGWCATVNRDCANCIHLILPLRRPGLPVFLGSQSCDPTSWLAERQLLVGDIESNPGPKPTLKTLLYTLTQSPTLNKYTNSPVQPSQSSPPSLSPAHSPPNSPTPAPLQNTPTQHRAYIQLHTLIYLKQHTGPLDVSRGDSRKQIQVLYVCRLEASSIQPGSVLHPGDVNVTIVPILEQRIRQ